MGFWGKLLDPLDLVGDRANKAASSREAAAISEYDRLQPPTIEFERLNADPYSQGAQRQAIEGLRGISTTGYDDIDRARIAQINQQQAQAAQANRLAGLEQLMRRGVQGGAQIASSLMGGQAAQNTAANQGLQLAAEGANRRMQALQQLGGQAGQLRSANDAINQFNIQNKRDVMQQNYANRADLAGNRANARLGIAANQTARDAGENQKKGQILGAVGSIFASDKRLKKDVYNASEDISDVFEAVSPKSFEYKDQPGRRFASVMAQDLEKSKLGKELVVEDENGTKGVDSAQATGMLLAAQKLIMDRLKKLEDKNGAA